MRNGTIWSGYPAPVRRRAIECVSPSFPRRGDANIDVSAASTTFPARGRRLDPLPKRAIPDCETGGCATLLVACGDELCDGETTDTRQTGAWKLLFRHSPPRHSLSTEKLKKAELLANIDLLE